MELIPTWSIYCIYPHGVLPPTSFSAVLQAQLVSTDVEGYIPTIDSGDFNTDLPRMSIQIPSELIKLFANSSGSIRLISAIFYNVEELFPSGRPGDNE